MMVGDGSGDGVAASIDDIVQKLHVASSSESHLKGAQLVDDTTHGPQVG